MHAVLGGSMNMPIVISDDEGEIMEIVQPTAPIMHSVPHVPNSTTTTPACATITHSNESWTFPQAAAVADAPAARLLKRLDVEQLSPPVGNETTGEGESRWGPSGPYY